MDSQKDIATTRGDSPLKWEQIFVLSLPRSGSTLLRLLLDTHPEITCPGELSMGELAQRFHHFFYYTSAQLLPVDDSERSLWAAEKVRESINGLMTSYSGAKGKRLWAEKTPSNLKHAALLKQIFPKAAFLCLHRHPLDLIRSGLQSSLYGKLGIDLWDYRSGCEFCLDQCHALLKFEASNSHRCFRLTYEELVNDLERTLEKTFAFLGLDADPTVMENVFTANHERGLGDPKAEVATRVYDTSIGLGHEIIPMLAEVPLALRRRLEMLITALGYEKVDLTTKRTPRRPHAPTQGSGRATTVEDLFRRHFPEKLLNQNNDLRGSATFMIKGSGGGAWSINLNTKPPEIVNTVQSTDCTITIKSDDLLRLASGELSAGDCYMQARVRIQGNETVAVALGRALFG